MPERFIHSRSLVIPSFVILLLVQCHQVLGQASEGGFLNPSCSGPGVWLKALMLYRNISSKHILKTQAGGQIIFMYKQLIIESGNENKKSGIRPRPVECRNLRRDSSLVDILNHKDTRDTKKHKVC